MRAVHVAVVNDEALAADYAERLEAPIKAAQRAAAQRAGRGRAAR
jgi:hypothetical protein